MSEVLTLRKRLDGLREGIARGRATFERAADAADAEPGKLAKVLHEIAAGEELARRTEKRFVAALRVRLDAAIAQAHAEAGEIVMPMNEAIERAKKARAKFVELDESAADVDVKVAAYRLTAEAEAEADRLHSAYTARRSRWQQLEALRPSMDRDPDFVADALAALGVE